MNLVLFVSALSIALAQPAQPTQDLAAGWRFKPDPEHVGLRDGWHTVSTSDGDWATVQAGLRWEDQGFPDADGYAWYRRWLDVPADWQGARAWLVLGAVNDAFTLYCNGVRVNAFGDATDNTVADIPAIADVTALLKPGEPNLLALECLDWGGSGGLWRLPCLITTDSAQLPLTSVVACMTEYEAHKLSVNVDLRGLGNDRTDMTLHVSLFKGDKDKPRAEQDIPVPAIVNQVSLGFDLDKPDDGDVYHIRVTTVPPEGAVLSGLTVEREVPWPQAPHWDGEYAELKVRNNFVTELLHLRVEDAGAADHPFLNPRKGWIIISAATGGEEGPQAVLDGETSPLLWRRNPASGAFEAMRHVTEGPHNLALASANPGELEVRTVPELMYCYYPAEPHIKSFGTYDWAYVSKHVLPHVNTLIASGSPVQEEVQRWRSEGRVLVSNASLPGLSDAQAPTADRVYEVWAANPGATQPHFSGMIVDEFLSAGADHYRAWTDAMVRLHETPGFSGKTFYAWCGDLYEHAPSAEFRQRVAELGYRFAWEKYLHEAPSELTASQSISRQLQEDLVAWQASMPDVAQRLVMTLGYLCAPPESQNLNPAVDYQVFMDMQFHRLATEPAFWGLFGIMEYSASYSDEESLRWAHQLIRHYCIEGKRERMTTDPYILPHIQNPDFVAGLDGWQVEPAAEGAIAPDTMEGFSWLQGRYPETTVGNQFCRMSRSAERPNRITQTIQALQPGRLYSVKLIGSALELMDREHEAVLRIQVDGAEAVPEFSFINPYPSNYGHVFGPYNRDHPAWFTFQRYVFRATAETAQLSIRDWVANDTPGADAGQNTAFNFVEVQPFHAP